MKGAKKDRIQTSNMSSNIFEERGALGVGVLDGCERRGVLCMKVILVLGSYVLRDDRALN